MSTIKLKYKRDKKAFVPDRDLNLPDNFEIELPEIRTPSLFDKEKLIKEIEEDGKKYFPEFKLSPDTKRLLGVMANSPFRDLLDEDLRRVYHENVWRSSDEKYNY